MKVTKEEFDEYIKNYGRPLSVCNYGNTTMYCDYELCAELKLSIGQMALCIMAEHVYPQDENSTHEYYIRTKQHDN